MSEITVGELLMQCLRAEEIEMMFGIIDGSHIPFVMHAPRYHIRHVNCRHEEAAVHLAEGYTRLARKPSVVFGSPGPGGANMLAGLTSAHAEGHPILALATTRRRVTTACCERGARGDGRLLLSGRGHLDLLFLLRLCPAHGLLARRVWPAPQPRLRQLEPLRCLVDLPVECARRRE